MTQIAKTIHTINTGKHVITVVQIDDVYDVRRQPINKKTGKPWQANNSVRKNCDCHKVWFGPNRTEIRHGHYELQPWPEGATARGNYFSTSELAIAEAKRLALKNKGE